MSGVRRRVVAAVALLCVAATSCDSGSVPAPGAGAVGTSGEAEMFGPGRHRVGTTIRAGRYYAAPAAGCYWERQSGPGGTAVETTAFKFIGFDAMQWVVDVKTSDYAFQTNAACGTWSSEPYGDAPAGTIASGAWHVGQQIVPGTYRSDATAGCYWERLGDFTGDGGSVLGAGLAATAGPVFVTIAAADAGFTADAACGTWTAIAVPGGPTESVIAPPLS